MSDAPALTSTAPAAPALPFEQLIYMRSPMGLVATTAAIFVLLFGSFLAIAAIEHVAILRVGPAFSGAAWPALVLSLLCCVALAMQRYARLVEAKDAPAYAKILTGGMTSARAITSVAPRDARLRRATLIGLILGLAISAIVRTSEYREGHAMPPLTLAWFVAVTTFMVVLFARGVEQTRAGNRGYGNMLDGELKIDLLRTDTLAVLGRSAARWALIWFVVSAVACLFFVGGDLNWLTIVLIASCAIIGVALFVNVMGRIHRQIVTTKQAELEHIRRQIDILRAGMHADDHAAARLHGLLAYEKRISDAPEWPFDQPTLVRIGAYILIPTIPWFGQTVVQYFFDHLTHG
jgi:hypothetical protein